MYWILHEITVYADTLRCRADTAALKQRGDFRIAHDFILQIIIINIILY